MVIVSLASATTFVVELQSPSMSIIETWRWKMRTKTCIN